MGVSLNYMGDQLQTVWFEADQWQLVCVNDRPHAGPHVGHAQSRQLPQAAHLVLRKKCGKVCCAVDQWESA